MKGNNRRTELNAKGLNSSTEDIGSLAETLIMRMEYIPEL